MQPSQKATTGATIKYRKMFKDKIIAAFKAKYPSINLSKARLNAIAAKIETKVVDDESKIDAALQAMDEVYAFSDIAKDDDRLRAAEAKAKGGGKTAEEIAAEKAAKDAAGKDDKTDLPDDTPAWAKALVESNKSMANQLAAIQGEKAATTIKGKIAEALKDKVPEAFWDEWQMPADEAGVEAFAEKATAKFAAINQERTNAGLGVLSTVKPAAGAGGGSGGAKEVSAEVKEFAAKRAKEAAATTAAPNKAVIISNS